MLEPVAGGACKFQPSVEAPCAFGAHRARRAVVPVDYALLAGGDVGLEEAGTPKRPRERNAKVRSTKPVAVAEAVVLELPDAAAPHQPGAAESTSRALLVKLPWARLLAKGTKTWELRSRHTLTRGRVALVASGTGGYIIGGATLVACHGPLTAAELQAASHKHRVVTGSFRYPRCVSASLSCALRLTRLPQDVCLGV